MNINVDLQMRREGTVETQSILARGPQPTAAKPGDTRPPLWRWLAMLRHPLTRAGRSKLPLYYFAASRTRIAPAPIGAPLAERMRRHCERAAIGLWWPIGKGLTLFWLWREGLDQRAVLVWWKAIAAGLENRKPVQPATSFSERSSMRDQAPPSSIGGLGNSQAEANRNSAPGKCEKLSRSGISIKEAA